MQVVLVVLTLVAIAVAVVALRMAQRSAARPVEPLPEAAAAADPPAPLAEDAAAAQVLAQLSLAMDRIPGGVVISDAAGRTVFRNAAAERLAAARDSSVLVAAAADELLAGAVLGQAAEREVELFGPPQQVFLVHAVPLTGGGGLVQIEDLTQDRRTDTVRRDFVANISHELKTPIGALGLLAETIRGEPDPQVVDRLADRMTVEAERASRTIDDLLELTRIEFGDSTEFDEFRVLDVVAQAVSRIGAAAEQLAVEVIVDVPASLTAVGDQLQVGSAVFNLLDNAVKYSPPGSEVHVGAGVGGSGDLEIRVTDAGVGIPQRDLDRVFERFYRVDRARSRATGGTGLGLAIVRHVAHNHGGEVAVDSVEGAGSTFTLRLPRGATTVPVRPEAEDPVGGQ